MEESSEYDFHAEIEMDPVPKARARIVRLGSSGKIRSYTPKRTHEAQEIIFLSLQDQKPDELFIGPIAARLLFYITRPQWHYKKSGDVKQGAPKYPISKRVGDLDNFQKTVLDACNKVLFDDDCQVCDITASKRYADDCSPRVIISIKRLLDG